MTVHPSFARSAAYADPAAEPEGFAELQDRYHRLVELAPDGILVHDGEHILMANAAAMAMAGAVHPHQVVGRPIEDFLNPPYLKGVEDQLIDLGVGPFIANGEHVAIVVRDRFHSLQGRDIDVEVTAIPFLHGGQPEAHLVIREITRPLRQEASVLRAESLLHLILEQLPATLWTMDVLLRISSVLGGRRASLFDRRDASRGVGRRALGDAITSELISKLMGSGPLAAGDRALRGEVMAYDADVDGRVHEVHVAPLRGPDGGVTGVLGIALDVTEIRKSRAHLQEVQKMEMVGNLAGGVAHEVNNAMTVVLAAADFLARSMSGDRERLGDIQQITRAAARAAKVTRQLLAFSRRAFIVPEIFELDTVVGGLVTSMRQLLGDTRTLIVDLHCQSHVRADRSQLEQVVLNLALNARDAMSPGDTLAVTTWAENVSGDLVDRNGKTIPPGRYALLSTRDTGAGMDSAVQAHIFDPFFTTKAVGQGTGLGLPAVTGIIEQHGGYITFESAPGRGATFTLYLPLQPECEPPDAIELKPVEPRGAGATVLVVEDEPMVRAVAVRILGFHGYRVLEAEDGVAALALADRGGAPDLVLTDLMMPNMGGRELARELTAKWPDLPILFMSGHPMDDLLREGVLAGNSITILHKPFTGDTLARHVHDSIAARIAPDI